MQNGFIVEDTMRNNKKYDGKTVKFGITIHGENYIVKLHEGNISKIYSEYVAQRFINALGVPCQVVYIGTYRNELVNIIKDFTTDECKLRTFKDTRQTSEGTDLSNKTYSYRDVIHLIEKHTKMSEQDKQKMIVQFWDMFICDAILGNRDRHHGNWGYITSPKGYKPSPIFDNGGSLFPDIQTKIDRYTENNEFEFLSERQEKFPAQLFTMRRLNGELKRTNYYELLGNNRFNKILNQEVAKIKKVYGYDGIRRIAYQILKESGSQIPNNYKTFYLRIIEMRYLHMIERLSLEDSYRIIKTKG